MFETVWYIGPDGLEYSADIDMSNDDEDEEPFVPDCHVCGDPIDYCMGGHAELWEDDFDIDSVTFVFVTE